jgi:hypothetical protein
LLNFLVLLHDPLVSGARRNDATKLGGDVRRSVLVLLLSGLAACQAHVGLNAPAKEAPLEERARAYEELRPLSHHESVLVTTQNGFVASATPLPGYLQLNSGARVYYAEDLLPVLPPDSVAAKAAVESQKASGVRDVFTGVGATIGGVGLVAMAIILASVPAVPNLSPSWTREEFDQHMSNSRAALGQTMIGAGVGIGGVARGTLVWLIGGLAEGRTITDSLRTAFETYDAGLRARLGVPAKGEVSPPPPAPPPPVPEVSLDRSMSPLSVR